MLKSILLPIDGSINSKLAAQLAWKLAVRTSAQVSAQHVVDLDNAWRLFGCQSSGFAGAADYSKAYASACKALLKLGGKILTRYEEEASSKNIDQRTLLDQGNPFQQICKQSRSHDLVVIGHKRAAATEKQNNNFINVSLAEMLAHSCPRPLLIVQDKVDSWQSLTIMISDEHINEVYIDRCLKLAEELGLAIAMVCLTAGANERRPSKFVVDLRAANPRLAEVPIEVLPLQSLSIDENGCWRAPEDKHPLGDWLTTLTVMPTRSVGGKRLTLLGISPVAFVRQLELPSLVLFPEESVTEEDLSIASTNHMDLMPVL